MDDQLVVTGGGIHQIPGGQGITGEAADVVPDFMECRAVISRAGDGGGLVIELALQEQ
jgi:hypothetical protein